MYLSKDVLAALSGLAFPTTTVAVQSTACFPLPFFSFLVHNVADDSAIFHYCISSHRTVISVCVAISRSYSARFGKAVRAPPPPHPHPPSAPQQNERATLPPSARAATASPARWSPLATPLSYQSTRLAEATWPGPCILALVCAVSAVYSHHEGSPIVFSV